jgi:hypothetical protein
VDQRREHLIQAITEVLEADRRALCPKGCLGGFMRALKCLNLTILSALIASSAALYAQDDKQQEDKPRQEEPKRQEAARPPKEGRQEQKQQKQEQKEEQRQGREMRPGQQENGQREGHARPTGKSAHIPEQKFRAQFGREHHFAVQRPVIVEGSPGFFYGGYSFVLVDPWPVEWAYTDDCYVDYVDGEYFLFDVFHPGVRIALFVVE